MRITIELVTDNLVEMQIHADDQCGKEGSVSADGVGVRNPFSVKLKPSRWIKSMREFLKRSAGAFVSSDMEETGSK